ncbi:NLRC4 [Branchiostoma lanceolatum]|uniref:NLRC4 protein n=1 Tax=Branchiostoma lanceolatum TaxID=7740 RepID=A0A8J9ZSR8_BRALA|nr:NLRC4 [Branchiostoma lanceolatum]
MQVPGTQFAGRNQSSVGNADRGRPMNSTHNLDGKLDIFRKRLSKFYTSTLNHIKPLAWSEKFSLDLSDILLEFEGVPITQGGEDEGEKRRSLSSIFELYKKTQKSPRCVLVESPLGSGKSTLLASIAVNWGLSQRNWAERFDYVFLIRLREVGDGESMEEIILDQCLPSEDEDIHREVIDHLLHKSKAKILFVLDGYDELHAGCKKKNGTIPKLLSGKIFKKTHILVSSLPSSGIEENLKVEQRVWVSGIAKENVAPCIERYFNACLRPELALELQSALRDAYTIPEDLLKSPIFLVLLCLVWEESLDAYRVLSNRMTLTGLYKEMLTSGVRRYCRWKHIDMLDDEDLPQNLSDCLKTLGQAALEGLKTHRSNFDVSEVTPDGRDIDFLLRLGMVSRVPTASKRHPREQITFNHKTMQEFLAARYIAVSQSCSQTKIQELISTIDASLEYRTLLQFLCGFNEQTAIVVFQQVCKLYNYFLKGYREAYYEGTVTGETARTYSDYMIMCLLSLRESQSRYIVAKVMSPVFHSINLSLCASCRLSAALKYLLQVAGNDVRQLKICFLNPGDDAAANYVTSLLSRSFPRLQLDVRLFDCQVGADRMGILAVRLRSAPCLQTLYLEGTHLDDEAAEALAHALFYVPLLEELELSNNQIGDPGMTAISKEIHNVPNLTFFGINDNDIGDASIVAMSTRLKHLPALRELRLGGNSLSASGIRTFFAVIPNMRNLDTLDLSSSSKDPARMDAKTVTSLVQAFPRLTGLVILKLQNLAMKKAQLEKIMKAAEEHTKLHKIWCSKNLVADVSKIRVQSRITLN